MYGKVDVTDHEGIDQPMDVNGYLGMTHFYRTHVKKTPITAKEFIAAIHSDDKQQEVMRTIGEIDKDHNGYVTASELDDILKLFYREHFEAREIIPIIKKFSSI